MPFVILLVLKLNYLVRVFTIKIATFARHVLFLNKGPLGALGQAHYLSKDLIVGRKLIEKHMGTDPCLPHNIIKRSCQFNDSICTNIK